jgi:hypothetical protein
MRYAPPDLAVLESHDVVKTMYERRHGGQISAGKVAEVASCFSQGSQYLAAAATAGELVSPLLVYYGLNALARGTVLFLDPKARLATLKPAHGLGIPSWQEHLATGLDRFADLNIDIDETGTFAEFTAATAVDTVTAFTDYKQVPLTIASTTTIARKSRVTVKQVLSRIPDLHELYETVLEEMPNVFAVGLGYSDSGRITLEVFGERIAPDVAVLQEAIPALATVTPEIAAPPDGRPSAKFAVEMSHEDVRLPLRSSAGINWLVVPLQPSLDLSFVSIYYLLSYATGMLCRYFPQHWLALLRGSRGDRLYPVVREGQAIVARRFQLEVASRLFPE